MKAVRYHEFGGPEVLKIEEVDVPEPGEGQVLIKVAGFGINPFDRKIMSGKVQDSFPVKFPVIPGSEASGTVVKVGPGVSGYQEGDEVFGLTGSLNAAAEYAVLKTTGMALKPPSLDLVDSAGVPVPSLTAWQALFVHGGVKAGQRVLIHAAAGGVGSFAVQMAKWKGAHVLATASGSDERFVRELGADEVVDYKTTRFEDVVHDVDMVLDAVGGDTQTRSAAVLKPGGILVSIVAPPDEALFQSQGKRAQVFFMQPNSDQLREISGLIEDLHVILIVGVELPLVRAAEAFAESESAHGHGRIIVRVS